ncbi:hypothetical protein HMI56_003651 [Coelomomyces lativittatus]|nr:hypothetical protein HMI56_003651 [Coelomomyces lativittatus]
MNYEPTTPSFLSLINIKECIHSSHSRLFHFMPSFYNHGLYLSSLKSFHLSSSSFSSSSSSSSLCPLNPLRTKTMMTSPLSSTVTVPMDTPVLTSEEESTTLASSHQRRQALQQSSQTFMDFRVSRVSILCKDCNEDAGFYPARHQCLPIPSTCISFFFFFFSWYLFPLLLFVDNDRCTSFFL